MHHTSTEKPMQCRAAIMLLRLLYQISGKYAMRSLRLLESCADGAPVRRAPLRRERPYAGGTPARGAPLRGEHPCAGSAKGARPPLWTPAMLRIACTACGRGKGRLSKNDKHKKRKG